MAIIKKLNGHTPKFGKNCFIADNAAIIGDVEMGDDCSIWFGAVLRGDVHEIRIGNKVNIQDNATIHATYIKSPTHIGNNVSIAHNAVVHGCTIHDHVLIGMGAIVLDNAVIESNVIVAAGCVVTKGMVLCRHPCQENQTGGCRAPSGRSGAHRELLRHVRILVCR